MGNPKEQDLALLVASMQIGHGNPACALAISNLLSREYEQVEYQLFNGPGVQLGRVIHEAMSQHTEASQAYTHQDAIVRLIALGVIGSLTLGEITHRRFQTVTRQHTFDHLVAVQEHLFGGLAVLRGVGRKILHSYFQDGVWLAVPDVYPKESGEAVASVLDIRPIVWAQTAFDQLQKKGLQPALVRPWMVEGFRTLPITEVRREDTIVVKASGSGMPPQEVHAIQELLESIHKDFAIPFSIWLPDRVLTPGAEVTALTGSLTDRLELFYGAVANAPPKVYISGPTEGIHLMTTLSCSGTQYLPLRPRGKHEAHNLGYAVRSGLSPRTSNLLLERDPKRVILDAWYSSRSVPTPDKLEIGSESITSLFGNSQRT